MKAVLQRVTQASVTQLKHKVNINTLEHLAAKQLELNEIGVCNLALDSMALATNSPLADASGCGLIGALGDTLRTPVPLAVVSLDAFELIGVAAWLAAEAAVTDRDLDLLARALVFEAHLPPPFAVRPIASMMRP